MLQYDLMKKILSFFLFIGFLIGLSIALMSPFGQKPEALSQQENTDYWFLLHRKSNIEFMYLGIPGDKEKSTLIKEFAVKAGIPNERPTPLPQLLGKKYWVVTAKSASDNPETAPYFITLNIPTNEEPPYGPAPYMECDGQCDWVLPGEFGLHGVNGDETRLSKDNPGSSGCIRHTDRDITYIYNTIDPKKEEIRYYIEDI